MCKEIFRCENHCISFNMGNKFKTEPVKNLNLSIHKGEIVAVLGASGSGKSLLAHSILGILPNNATYWGDMFFENSLLDNKGKKKLRGNDICLVPQNVSFLDPLMKVGKQIDGKSKEKVLNLMEKYHLGKEVYDMYPFELSGGMARRILISMATINNPKLVIADEPTNGLDNETMKMVLSHFRDMANQGSGVLLITHDLEGAMFVADRIIVLNDGKTVEDSPCLAFREKDKNLNSFAIALLNSLPSKEGFIYDFKGK